MVAVGWLRWPPCPYIVKTFKNLLLQNRKCLGAESLHESSGTGDLLKLLKELSYVDVWPFYGKVKFASLCICMSPIHFNGKIVENFKGLLLWSHWAKFAQIFCSPEHEVLMVSYCGQSKRRRGSCVVRRASCGVNNCFKSLLLLRPWANWLDTWQEASGWLVDEK